MSKEKEDIKTCTCDMFDVKTYDEDLPCDWCTNCGKKFNPSDD